MASEQLIPDLIGYNGNVITVDPYKPRAQAFAVREGAFVAVGDNDEIKDMAGPPHPKDGLRGEHGCTRLHRRPHPRPEQRDSPYLDGRLRPPVHRRDPGGHTLQGGGHGCRRLGARVSSSTTRKRWRTDSSIAETWTTPPASTRYSWPTGRDTSITQTAWG